MIRSNGIEFYVEVLSGGKSVKTRLESKEKGLFFASVLGAEFSLKVRFKKEGAVDCNAEAHLNGRADGYAFSAQIKTQFPFDNAQFFAPACWYGSLENSKFPLVEGEACGGVDSLSAPLVGVYAQGNGVILSDCTEGRRETCEGDYNAGERKDLVSSHFRFPSLGVRKDGKKVTLLYSFPAVTCGYCGSGGRVRRYLNTEKCNFSFRVWEQKSDSFPTFQKDVWRDAYRERAVVDDTVDVSEGVNAVLRRVEASYGKRNGIPQFMTNCDHFVPESGFLYRNADLASLLLRMKRAGFEVLLSDERLIEVIDVQVRTEYAGARQFFQFYRSRFEGVDHVLEAYLLLKKEGICKREWWDFVKKEGEVAISADEFFSVPLLTKLYRETGEERYLIAAREKCERAWKEFSQGRFYGGIVDFCGSPPLDKESGIAGMDAFLSLYSVTEKEEDILRACRCADYTETYHQLQDINLEPVQFDDRKFHAGAHGNSHVSTRGIGFISNTCAAGDLADVLAYGRFLELSALVGDGHYKEFSELLFRNAFYTVNLDDKAGAMADALYSVGAGFVNEYIQMGISTDPVGLGRGMMHDSDIAWNQYTLLKAAFDRKRAGLTFPAGKGERLRVLQVNNREEKELFDGNFSTLSDVAGKCIAMAFGEEKQVEKIVFAFLNADEPCECSVECLKGGKPVKKQTFFHAHGFYGVCPIRVRADEIFIRFQKAERIILRQIQPFGFSKKPTERRQADGVTSVGLTLDGKVTFFAGETPIGFDNERNSYCAEGAEFLQKGLLRIHGRCARCLVTLPNGRGIFSFAPEPNEVCEGNVKVQLFRAGECVFETVLQGESRVFKGETGGETELRFTSDNRNSVRFAFYVLEEKDLIRRNQR